MRGTINYVKSSLEEGQEWVASSCSSERFRSRRQEVSQTLLSRKRAKQSQTPCKKKKKRITFNKALHVKFEPLGSYTNTFVPVSFWYALAADLWEEVSCRHKIKFNCLEIWSVIQRPNEGVFELTLEKEKGSKADFKWSEHSLPVSWGVPPAVLVRGRCSVLQVGGTFPSAPWAWLFMRLTAVALLMAK